MITPKSLRNQNAIGTDLCFTFTGTGKSLLIKCITAVLREKLGSNSFILSAPTGAAAVLIEGKTLHSVFHLSRHAKEFKPLTGQSARNLTNKLKDVYYIIIDEYSMVGATRMAMIDMRCKEATGNSEEPFGGLHVILLGDLKQLPPVKDTPCYSQSQKLTNMDKHGLTIYNGFQKKFILKKCFRQENDSFLKTLDNISDGHFTLQDYELLATRFFHNASEIEKQNFQDALRLFATKAQVKDYNEERMTQLRDPTTNRFVPITKIEAQHNSPTAKSGSTDDSDGLEKVLYLSRGCDIMLRQNLWTEKGLVNGARGKIVDILYDGEKTSKTIPKVILCEFPHYIGPSMIPGRNIIPIKPVLRSWKPQKGDTCTRYQFPIMLSYACTIHKAQGMTLDKVGILT